MKRNNITGIILAGGKSKRMGEDKGLVKYKKKTFIEHILITLKPFVGQIIIVSNSKNYDIYGCRVISDVVQDKGPLGGLYSALLVSKTKSNLVLSCDIPLIDKSLLEILINQNLTNYDGIVCQSKGKIMPLIAIYKRKCILICKKLLKTDQLRMMTLLDNIRVKKVIVNKNLEYCTMNINSKKELNKIAKELS